MNPPVPPPPSLSLSSIMLLPSTLRIQNPPWHSWGKKEKKPGIFFFFLFCLFFVFEKRSFSLTAA